MNDTAPIRRSERRERTHSAILAAARQVFAENGYQKATIRAVAAQAGCDPALVMQHFGSKQQLFRAATDIGIDIDQALANADGDEIGSVLRHTFGRMDANPQAVASTLRSMLTHDEIADEAFQLFNPPLLNTAAPRAGTAGERDDLRQQLLVAFVLGAAINRYVLRASVVEKVTLEDLVACMRPAAEALSPPSTRQLNRPEGLSS